MRQIKIKNTIYLNYGDDNEWVEFIEKTGKDKKTRAVIVNQGVHGLGIIPVKLYYYGKKVNLEDIEVNPPYLGIARVNFALFNVDSENRDNASSQRFSTLYLQGVKSTSQTVGSKAVINIPSDPDINITPGMVGPDVNLGKDGRDEANELIESMHQLANQSGVIGIEKAESGISKAYDFFAQETVLKETVRVSENIEEWIERVFKLYTDAEFEVIVEYPQKFQPINTTELIADIDKQLMWNLTPEAEAYLIKKAMRLTAGKDESEEAQKAIDSITAEAINRQFSQQNDPLNVT